MLRRSFKRRQRPQRALIATGLVVATSLLAACGTSGPSDAGDGGITVWALQDDVLNEIEKQSIESFNTEEGGNATLQTFGNDPYKEKLRVALGSPNAPDVFFNWGGGNLAEYVQADRVADLTPMLEENPDLKQSFLPSVLDAAKIDGKYYGLPMRGMQPVALFYNKAVFEKAGAEPPETWADLMSLVDTFKGEGIQPIALAGSQAWTELMWAEYLLDRIGGPEVFQDIRDGKPGAWQHPAVVESMSKITELVEAGAFGKNYASVGYDVGGASTILAQGKAAMHLMGSWEYVNQLGQSPEFVERGDLGWVPFPSIAGGKGDPANVVGNPTNFYSVSAQSQNQDSAKKFISTQLNDPEYVQALIDAGDVPAVSGVEDKLANAENSEYTTWIYELVKEAPNFQLSWDQDLPADEATFMLTQLQKLFLGELTAQQFADSMAQH
ncbi:carbohydrate ABC transporter substrate-binding protein (CUT1 family) [Prauserella shujinwangii]|uniref:Carbohydrate ABC transporter substrate-binding protein (CUT1 family) n=1 Tax=Prauserella shujinwangii TaxID=1453103 RepID=A0A2T0LQY8_9PSEU|nr:extracellular solute-binding protein [Prauserella shujinwangii]PRX45898.1 carbohydrate ABC transporter substrate-binding protein (CUT1 family) [Prauserella shujinwangii]